MAKMTSFLPKDAACIWPLYAPPRRSAPQVAWTAAQLRRHAGNAQLSPSPPTAACRRRAGPVGWNVWRDTAQVQVWRETAGQVMPYRCECARVSCRGSGDGDGGCHAATAGDGVASSGDGPAAAASARAHSMIGAVRAWSVELSLSQRTLWLVASV